VRECVLVGVCVFECVCVSVCWWVIVYLIYIHVNYKNSHTTEFLVLLNMILTVSRI